MPTIRVKTPVGKTLIGLLYGSISLAALLQSRGRDAGAIIVTVVFGIASFVWLRRAYRHAAYLRSSADKNPPGLGQ